MSAHSVEALPVPPSERRMRGQYPGRFWAYGGVVFVAWAAGAVVGGLTGAAIDHFQEGDTPQEQTADVLHDGFQVGAEYGGRAGIALGLTASAALEARLRRKLDNPLGDLPTTAG